MPASVKLVANTKEIQKALAAVFAKWTNDSRYYQVEVLSCDQVKRQCRVRFEDRTEHVIDCANMHLQLDLDELNDKYIVCAICDSGASDHPNSIIMCDVCCQGFHVKCHKPNIKGIFLEDEDILWQCSTCNAIIKEATKKTKDAPAPKQKPTPRVTRKSKAERKIECDPELEPQVETGAAKKPLKKAPKNVQHDGERPRKKARQEKPTTLTVADIPDEAEKSGKAVRVDKIDKADKADKANDNEKGDKNKKVEPAQLDDEATQENLVVSNEVEVVTSEEDEASEKCKKPAPETKDKEKKKRKVTRDDDPLASELDNALDTSKFINQIATKKDIRAA